jgi:hypothetical protein
MIKAPRLFLTKQISLSILFAVLLMSTGCGPRLASVQEIALEANDIRSIVLEPISREQIINVLATSDGPPFHVHVYLFQDEQAVDDAISLGKTSDKVIASKSKSNQISLEALIPANQEAAIRLQSASPESVTVSLTVTNF